MRDRLRRTPGLSPRARIMLAILLAAGWAWVSLGLRIADLLPDRRGLHAAGPFFRAALSPALDYEASFVPPDAPAFGWVLWHALRRTLIFAVAGMSLALLCALPLAVCASNSFWQALSNLRQPLVRARTGLALQTILRFLLAILRSVHELLWAVLFLAAFGLSPTTAVLALALPYTGTLAKVISEMLDECPPNLAEALGGLGAHPLAAFLWGRLPRALPDIASYAFYRFECAVRSSAILGFFGYETLGYYIKASFDNLHYREVWTWLYALCILVLLLESWSSSMRKRFVA